MDPIRGTSKARKQIQKHHGKNGTSRRVSSWIIWNYSNTSRFKAISGFNGCSFERDFPNFSAILGPTPLINLIWLLVQFPCSIGNMRKLPRIK